MRAPFPILKAFRRDEGGAAIVEMAVVFPVIFAIGLGVIEFGNLYYNYHLIANGVRDGARYAAGFQGEVVCGDPLDASTGADTTARVTAIKTLAMTGQVFSSADFASAPKRVSFWDDLSETAVSCSTYDNSAFNYRGAITIYTVTVSAEVPYNSLGFLGYFGLTAPTLTVSHEERVYNVR